MVIRLLEEYRRYLPGAQIEVSAVEARRLIEAGRAVPVRDPDRRAVEWRRLDAYLDRYAKAR